MDRNVSRAARPVPASERRNHTERQALVVRMRAEFKENRRVAFSPEDTARRFGIDLDTSRRILSVLVSERVLRVNGDGRFVYHTRSHSYRT